MKRILKALVQPAAPADSPPVMGFKGRRPSHQPPSTPPPGGGPGDPVPPTSPPPGGDTLPVTGRLLASAGPYLGCVDYVRHRI